jgi:hypothetical protein
MSWIADMSVLTFGIHYGAALNFFFKLQEGYLFRIKQPRTFTRPAGAM